MLKDNLCVGQARWQKARPFSRVERALHYLPLLMKPAQYFHHFSATTVCPKKEERIEAQVVLLIAQTRIDNYTNKISM